LLYQPDSILGIKTPADVVSLCQLGMLTAGGRSSRDNRHTNRVVST